MVSALNQTADPHASEISPAPTDKDQRAIIRANLEYVGAMAESAMGGIHLDTADAATIKALCQSSLKALDVLEGKTPLMTYEQARQWALEYIMNGGCDGSCNGGSDVCFCAVPDFACPKCGRARTKMTVETMADEVSITGGRCSQCYYQDEIA